MMAFAVVAPVVGSRILLVGFGRDAGFESKRLQQSAESDAAVCFVGEYRSGTLARHEFRSADAVVAVAGAEHESDGTAFAIDQRMDLRVGSSFGGSDALGFNALGSSEGVFVNLGAGGVDRPELSLRRCRERIEDAVPHTGVAPEFPSGVDGGVRGEDAQSPPGAPFPQPEKHRLENQLAIGLRPAALAAGRCTYQSLR